MAKPQRRVPAKAVTEAAPAPEKAVEALPEPAHEDAEMEVGFTEGSDDEGEEEDGGEGEEEDDSDDEGGEAEIGADFSGGEEGDDEEDEDEVSSDLGADDEAGASGSDADDEDDEGKGAKGKPRAPPMGGAKFTEGGKAASFSKAMAKILGGNGRRRAALAGDDAPAAGPSTSAPAAGEGAAAAGTTARPRAAAAPAVPILLGSKSTLKRQAENEAEVVANKEARKERQERRQRGHAKVPKRGTDPASDLLEKQLARVATRGVVMLFNAVSTAQHEALDALASAKKATKISKASFLKQLRAGTGGAEGEEKKRLPSGAPGRRAASAAAAAAAGPAGDGGAAGSGWKVLQDGFTGIAGGTKMKDWDKEAEEDSGNDAEQLDGSQSSDSGGGGQGW